MNQRSGGIFTLLGLIAVFFLLQKFFPAFAKLFLILAGLAVIGVAALVAMVIYLAFRKPKKSPQQRVTDDARAEIQKGRSQLMDIRRLVMKIRNQDIRTVSESICATMDKILRALKERPDDIPRVGRFFRYYMPTLKNILTTYLRLEERGVPTADTAQRTLSGLKDMEKAMEKQYLNLFEDDKLDLSVEVEVMTQICKRDGLLADDYQLPEMPSPNQQQETEDQAITLTL